MGNAKLAVQEHDTVMSLVVGELSAAWCRCRKRYVQRCLLYLEAQGTAVFCVNLRNGSMVGRQPVSQPASKPARSLHLISISSASHQYLSSEDHATEGVVGSYYVVVLKGGKDQDTCHQSVHT